VTPANAAAPERVSAAEAETLPRTGANVRPYVMVGALLLLAGSVILAIARRRPLVR
jgi:LPXTG-motif cell wall-anchored protein